MGIKEEVHKVCEVQETNDEAQIKDLIAKEYIAIINIYEVYEQRSLLIKGWAFTLISGAIVFSYNYAEAYIALSILSALGSIIFWYLDTKWKQFQYYFKPRIKDIESFMRGENEVPIHPMQVHAEWYKGLYAETNKEFFKMAKRPMVSTPYIYLIMVILALLVYEQFVRFFN